MTRRVLFLLLLCLARPAWAGFDTEIDLAGAYGYDGTICTSTGSIGSPARVVPRCTGLSTDGTFLFRHFTRVLSGAAVFTVQIIRFGLTTEPDSQAAAGFIVECTALPPGSNGYNTTTFGTDATVSVDLDASANCADIGDVCHSGASSTVAIWNHKTGADCANTDCNNAELICRVTYDGNGTDIDDTVEPSSIKLTIGP
jgi:hypothetical protein